MGHTASAVRELGILVPTFAWLVPGVLIAAALFTALVLFYLSGAVGVEAINVS